MINEYKWEKLFGIKKVEPDSALEQRHCNLAYAIQKITEEIVIKMAQEAKRITGSDYLCMSGGVALNCVANGKLIKEKIFKDIYIQPASGDAGGALGAALAAYYIYFQSERRIISKQDQMKGSYLGPEYSDKEALITFKKHKAVFTKFDSFSELCTNTAELIKNANIIGWFQGRMEFGPRALGNRSIIADARNGEMQKKLNIKIKYREGFRPFAPSVLAEKYSEYFELNQDSPYMLLVADVKKNRRNELPNNYYDLNLWDRLYYRRSDLQSITHLDFSARIQTVHRETNYKYWQLINSFDKLTGYGVIVNTSFNVRGEPIVCTPDDAYRCFMRTEMDYLVINNFLLKKTDQPDWQDKEKWMEKFKLD